MKEQISADYKVLCDNPMIELYADYFLKDGVVYATAKVIDESISKNKPIWSLEINYDSHKDLSFDEIIYQGLNPGKKINRRVQNEIIGKLRKIILQKAEEDIF